MPITMRAGMVSATFSTSSVVTWAWSRPRLVRIACSIGARLNHTTKVRKKANHVRCRIRILPVKERRLNFSLVIMGSH